MIVLQNAIMETYRTAGKTVFFSGVAVMIGFASIGFSTFKLYQSAAAVAVGVAILYCTCNCRSLFHGCAWQKTILAI